MQRPTVHDIAENAGVSLATVDRVLNRRPGVRPETVQRVQNAIQKIGYVRDVAAANLARQRNYNLVFIIPNGSTAMLQKLDAAINEAKTRSAVDRTNITALIFPANDPHALVKMLRDLDLQRIDGVAIMAPETPHVRDEIRHLKEQSLSVLAIISDLPNCDIDAFVGTNSLAAGRTAGKLMGRFLPNEKTDILVLAGSILARDHAERRLGFDEIMAESFPNIRVLPTIEVWDDAETIERLLPDVLKRNPSIKGIYSVGGGNAGLERVLNGFHCHAFVVIVHELTSQSRAALEAQTFDAVIAQDFGHVVRSAVRMLKANSDKLDVIPSQERIRIDVFLKENLV